MQPAAFSWPEWGIPSDRWGRDQTLGPFPIARFLANLRGRVFVGRAVFSSFSVALGAAALALLFLVPAARSETSNVIWSSPTPADQARFTVNPGKSITFSLTASSEEPGGIVKISPASKLPKGALFNSSDGVAARATFKWSPDLAGRLHSQVHRHAGGYDRGRRPR